MDTSGTIRKRAGRKRSVRFVVRLSAEERAQLEGLLKRGKAAAYKRRHAQVLLKADEGELGPAWIDERIAEAVGVTPLTVRNVRRRLVEQGLEAAIQRKKQVRPSRQLVLDGAKQAQLVALACGPAPAGQARWTLSLLADKLVQLQIVPSVSLETVRQALKKTTCSPGTVNTGASHRKPTPSSSARWKRCSMSTSNRTTPKSRWSASTSVPCN